MWGQDRFGKITESNGTKGYSLWECNLAAVWGQLATGGGLAPLRESMSVLGVPVMTKNNNKKTTFEHREKHRERN